MAYTTNSDGTYNCTVTGTRFQTSTGAAPTTPTTVYNPGGHSVAGTWSGGQVNK